MDTRFLAWTHFNINLLQHFSLTFFALLNWHVTVLITLLTLNFKIVAVFNYTACFFHLYRSINLKLWLSGEYFLCFVLFVPRSLIIIIWDAKFSAKCWSWLKFSDLKICLHIKLWQKEDITCMNFVHSNEWIRVNIKSDLYINHHVSAINVSPLKQVNQEFWHILNQ